ncbi:site-2 protease family protein [Nannocystaceae bacterium ST9]
MSESFYRPPTETDRQDRGSWHLGRFFGIPTRIHFSFVLVLLWIGGSTWMAQSSGAAVLLGLGFALAVFACVLLHEFGHALVARRFGIRTRRITLWPIGGVAELERSPEDPRAELWIAAAGPLVNFAIAALLVPAVLVLGTGGLVGTVLVGLLSANLMLGLFNLIPAFPMDGGRVFRALLERKHGRLRATEIAAKLGRWVALGVGLWALWNGEFLLMLVAAFVYFAARRELWQARVIAQMEQERMAGAQWIHAGPMRAGFDPMAGGQARPRVIIIPR